MDLKTDPYIIIYPNFVKVQLVKYMEGIVVLWFDCLPVMQELGVRFPSNWKESGDVKLIWRRPGGHGINYTSGTAVTWRGGMTATLTW